MIDTCRVMLSLSSIDSEGDNMLDNDLQGSDDIATQSESFVSVSVPDNKVNIIFFFIFNIILH